MKFNDTEIKESASNEIPIKTVFGGVYFDSYITGANEDDIVGAWVYHKSIHELFCAANEDLISQ